MSRAYLRDFAPEHYHAPACFRMTNGEDDDRGSRLHTDVDYVKIKGASGWRVRLWCWTCNDFARLHRRQPGGSWFRSAHFNLDALAEVPCSADEIGICAACGLAGHVEQHHWAPRHLFGDEAYRWPTAELCRSCHERWHAVVTPNMTRKG